MAVVEGPPASPPVASVSRRRRAVGIVFVLVALAAAVGALVAQWGPASAALRDLRAGWVAAAAVASGGSLAASFVAWRATLAGLGAPLPWRIAGRVFFLGQVGKYLPGSVWAVLAQMELGRAAGVRRERTAVAGLLVLLVSLTAALALGLLALPTLLAAGASGYALLPALVLPLVALLHPRVLGPVLDRVARLLRRSALEVHPTGRVVARVAAWSVLSNGLQGVAAWCLALGLGAGDPLGLLPLVVGGFALAAAAGFLVVPLPAGAGVREGVLVLVLAPQLGLARATLVALLSRLLLTAADVLAAAVAGVRR